MEPPARHNLTTKLLPQIPFPNISLNTQHICWYNQVVIKNLLRLSVFVTISLKLTQYVIGGYEFGNVNAIFLFILGITVLYFFMRPILGLVSLPDDGVGFLFMSFVLTLITSYFLTIFIPTFSVRETTMSELLIFGFMLPSKHLDVMWSMVFSALLMAVLMLFFNWLCESKKWGLLHQV